MKKFMVEKIEIWGVNDPNVSAQLALASILGLFKSEAGIEVSCKLIESGTLMVERVLHAEVPPFAYTQTPITAILMREKGIGTKLIAPLADIAATQQVIIRRGSGILAPQDLEGKRIGIMPGAAVYLALKGMARECQVDLKKVHFVDLLPQDQLTAFQAGTLDAIASWEPWTTKAQALGGQFYFSGTRSEIPGKEGNVNWLINQSCLIVPDKYLKTWHDLVIAILKVLHRATELINNRRDDVVDPLAKFFQISRAELLVAMEKNTYSLAVNSYFKSGVSRFRDFLYEDGQISAPFPVEVLYDTSFLHEIDPALVLLEDTVPQELTIIEENSISYREDFVLVSDGSPLKFLLADDSRFMRALLDKAIKRIGGQVVGEAKTDQETMELFTHLQPDVITMDLSVPPISRIETIKTMLQIDPDVTIIVISHIDLQEMQDEMFNLGIKMFIKKPFDLIHLITILKDRLIIAAQPAATAYASS